MRTSFSWRLLVTRLVQTLSAEYSGLPTAAKRGQKFCLKMKTPAGSMSFLIRTIRTLFSLHCGRLDDSRGFFPAAVQEAASTDLKIMALPGNVSRAMACLKESSVRPASRFPVPIRTAFMRSSRRKRAAFIVPRSEEHTSELQSPDHLVCRLLLEK